MSTLKLNMLQIGTGASPSVNFTFNTPAVPDGTLYLQRGNAGGYNPTVAYVDQSNNVWFANRIGSGADAAVDSDAPRWGQVKTAIANGAHMHTSGSLAMDNAGTDGNGYYNYVYPPAGKNIGQILNVMCSIREVYYAGDVNYDDSVYCFYEIEWANNRVKFICYSNERRSRCAINWDIAWAA